MPAKRYVALHAFSTRIDDATGAEKTYQPGDVYDGPHGRVDQLLAGVDFHGPLIAEKSAAAPIEGK